MPNAGLLAAFTAIGVAVSVASGHWVWVGVFLAIGIALSVVNKR